MNDKVRIMDDERTAQQNAKRAAEERDCIHCGWAMGEREGDPFCKPTMQTNASGRSYMGLPCSKGA